MSELKRRPGTADPAIAEELAQHAPGMAEAIAERANVRRCVAWVKVEMWEDANGQLSTVLRHDPDTSDLEMKGYLHDALWSMIHAQETV